MKRKLIHVLAVLAIMSVFISSCNKDNGPDNYMKIDDRTYSLSKGYCLYYGHSSDYLGYDIQVCIGSSKVNYNGTWSGSGNMLWFGLASSSEQELPDGTYTFSYTFPLPNFSFIGSSNWETGWNTSDMKSATLDAGEVQIRNLGDNVYEFTVNCTDMYDQTVTAHFKGIFTFIDKTGK